MTKHNYQNRSKHHARQRGAVLLVALVFLLILTTLAVTSMREVAVDSRITANLIDQKQLFNASEAGLKDAEYRTIGTLVPIPGDYTPEAALRPVDAEGTCPAKDGEPCLLNQRPEYSQDFETTNKVRDYSPDATTDFDEDIKWYALPAPGGRDHGESENPEYGNMLRGKGLFRYELNSRATSDGGSANLRSTISRIYN